MDISERIHQKDYGNSEEIQVSMARMGDTVDTKIVVQILHQSNLYGRTAKEKITASSCSKP